MDILLATHDKNEFFMGTVYEVARLSKDPRTKIGAVLVKNNNIISVGYNNFPSKVLDLESRYNTKEIKYQFIVHAELNSILNAAKQGIHTNNSILFTQGIPCNECAKAIIQGGIRQVVVHYQWPNLIHSPKWVQSIETSKIMFEESKVDIVWFNLNLGIKGFLDGKFIDV